VTALRVSAAQRVMIVCLNGRRAIS
jgi:hypothetical protein